MICILDVPFQFSREYYYSAMLCSIIALWTLLIMSDICLSSAENAILVQYCIVVYRYTADAAVTEFIQEGF